MTHFFGSTQLFLIFKALFKTFLVFWVRFIRLEKSMGSIEPDSPLALAMPLNQVHRIVQFHTIEGKTNVN